MRQILSTALVALIVGAVAGASMGALAQTAPAPEPERAVEPAGLDADRVDGKHAVSYTNKRLARRNRLVATNKQGFLPSNIVKPYWGNIRNKPAGFADGVDDVGGPGYVSWVVPVTYSVSTGSKDVMVQYGDGVDTELQILPLSVNDEVLITSESFKRVAGGIIQHWYKVERHPWSASATVQFAIRVRAFNEGIAPATVKTAALKRLVKDAVQVKVVKRGRR